MSETPPPRSAQAAILIPLATVTLIWGSTWLVIRDQLGVVPPSWSVTYRFLVGGVAMTLYALARRDRWRFDALGLAFAAVIGLAQFCLNFNFVYRAEHFVTSGLVAVVFALLLIPNAVLARIFLGQRLGRQFVIGSAVAMSGGALLFLNEVRADPNNSAAVLTGIAYTLAAVIAASIANVLEASDIAKRYPMAPTLAIAMLTGAALNAAAAWWLTGPPLFELRGGYIAGVLYLGLVASTLAFPLYYGVVRVVGPAKAAYSNVMVPVIAMLLSTLFEGYRWSTISIVGALVTGAGLIIALRARRPAR